MVALRGERSSRPRRTIVQRPSADDERSRCWRRTHATALPRPDRCSPVWPSSSPPVAAARRRVRRPRRRLSHRRPRRPRPRRRAPASQPPPREPIKIGVVTDVGQLEDKSFNQSLVTTAPRRPRGDRRHARRHRHQSISRLRREHPDLRRPGLRRHRDRRLPHRDRHDERRQGQPGHQVHRRRPGRLRRRERRPRPDVRLQGRCCELLPNYQGIVFAEEQAGYLAGIVAASISKTGTIGAVGGINVPAVVNYIARLRERRQVGQARHQGPLPGTSDPDPAKAFNDPTDGQDDRQAVHRTRTPTSSSRSPA